jgi:hypothetical protein
MSSKRSRVTEQSDNTRIDLKTSQVAAGSLASVTSAVAASGLGVAGTLVGAGVGSVVGTVAGAVYEHYLDRTHHRVRSVVPRRASGAETRSEDTTPAEALVVDADTEPLPLAPTPPAPPAEPSGSPVASSRPTWAWLRSRRVALGLSAAAGLGVALVALTGFEAVTGKPVSSGGTSADGTSIGQVFGGGSSSDAEPETNATPTPEAPTPEAPAGSSTPPLSETSSSPTAANPTPSPQPSTPSTSPTTGPIPGSAAPDGG